MDYTVPDYLLRVYVQLLALGPGPVVDAHLEPGEQGAEGGRTYEPLLGVDGSRAGMALFFARHDGHAVTCDFLQGLTADKIN